MAFDEGLAQRLREAFAAAAITPGERRMFGGLCFLVRGHMACGIVGDTLMVRVGAARYAEALARPHARPMDFTGKPLTGMVYVAPAGIEDDATLVAWLRTSLDFIATLPDKR